MATLQELNKQLISNAKENGSSQGLKTLRQALNRTTQGYLDIYFTWVTKNRLEAYIISPEPYRSELVKLVIPEAGYRLYANWKDGYQVNGGGYSKTDHVADAMVWAIVKQYIDPILKPNASNSARNEHFNSIKEYIRAVSLD
jgi:hypothetical protein